MNGREEYGVNLVRGKTSREENSKGQIERQIGEKICIDNDNRDRQRDIRKIKWE